MTILGRWPTRWPGSAGSWAHPSRANSSASAIRGPSSWAKRWRRTRPRCTFATGVLRVTVDDPAWASQFRYLADGLVTELATRVPDCRDHLRLGRVVARAPTTRRTRIRPADDDPGSTGGISGDEPDETRRQTPSWSLLRGTLQPPRKAHLTRTFAQNTAPVGRCCRGRVPGLVSGISAGVASQPE